MKDNNEDKITKTECAAAGLGIMWLLFGAIAAGLLIGGCKSIEVQRHAASVATYTDTNGVTRAVCDKAGKPVILDGGWTVEYFQHWNWQKFDNLTAHAGPDVSLELNGYESGADSNVVALVSACFDGGARLATAIGDAYVKIAGGGAQAQSVLTTAQKIYAFFKSKGGDVNSATVTTSGDKLTVSDGNTCISCDKNGNCTSCSESGGCSGGTCKE